MTVQSTSASAGTNAAQLVKPLLAGYIPARQVAQELGKSLRFVWRMAAEGQWGKVKIGRDVYFHRETITKWLQERTQAATDISNKFAALRSDVRLRQRRRALSK